MVPPVEMAERAVEGMSADALAGMIMQRMDTNSDGKLSKEEVAGEERMKNAFAEYDTNQDGFVDSKELATVMKKRMASMGRGPGGAAQEEVRRAGGPGAGGRGPGGGGTGKLAMVILRFLNGRIRLSCCRSEKEFVLKSETVRAPRRHVRCSPPATTSRSWGLQDRERVRC
jgi:hypothetical protein